MKINKLGILLFIVLLFYGSFSQDANNQNNAKQKSRKGMLKHRHHRDNLKGLFKINFNKKGYARMVLNEINEYRKSKIYAEDLEWNDNLANTATQEAIALKSNKNSFSDHENFNKWGDKYEGFSEISINYYASQSGSKKAFAAGILQSLLEKYKSNLVQKYSIGGVAIEPDIIHNGRYIVVLHLAEKGNGNKDNLKNAADIKKLRKISEDHIKTYKSCKEAQEKKEKKEWILVDGKTTKCDYRFDGGGWSRVLDSDWEGHGVLGIIPIDDRNIKFKEILFRMKKGYYFKATNDNAYWSTGYNFRWQGLRIGEKWYLDKEAAGYAQHGGVYGQQINYTPNDQTVKVFQRATQCFTAGRQNLDQCAEVFKFINVPPGRLSAFADAESTTKKWSEDNHFNYAFELFVR